MKTKTVFIIVDEEWYQRTKTWCKGYGYSISDLLEMAVYHYVFEDKGSDVPTFPELKKEKKKKLTIEETYDIDGLYSRAMYMMEGYRQHLSETSRPKISYGSGRTVNISDDAYEKVLHLARVRVQTVADTVTRIVEEYFDR